MSEAIFGGVFKTLHQSIVIPAVEINALIPRDFYRIRQGA